MIGAVAAIVVGAVFVVAGAAKIALGARWPAQARGVGVPPALAAFVPWWEIVLGALLVAQVERGIVAWIAIATLVAMSATVGAQLAAGRHPPCACFGGWSAKPVSGRTLARNAALIAVALVAAVA